MVRLILRIINVTEFLRVRKEEDPVLVVTGLRSEYRRLKGAEVTNSKASTEDLDERVIKKHHDVARSLRRRPRDPLLTRGQGRVQDRRRC